MAYLGIDVGSKKIGFSYSATGEIAEPLCTLPKKEAIAFVKEMKIKKEVTDLVIGMPQKEGRQNDNVKNINAFASLFRGDFVIHFTDESNTTGSALSLTNHMRGAQHGKSLVSRSEHLDATAAALILQRFLDIKTR